MNSRRRHQQASQQPGSGRSLQPSWHLGQQLLLQPRQSLQGILKARQSHCSHRWLVQPQLVSWQGQRMVPAWCSKWQAVAGSYRQQPTLQRLVCGDCSQR